MGPLQSATANPVTYAELAEAYLADALFDAHRDDAESGYRFLADEAREAGPSACDRDEVGVLALGGHFLDGLVQPVPAGLDG